MTMFSLNLAGRVRDGESLHGCLVRMPCEELLEMLAVAGHDYVIIDCEHGPDDANDLRHHITIAQLHGMEVIVRIGEGDDSLVLRALDAGASGILAPHVDTKEDAERVVRACHYPPIGTRGFATYGRAGGYGTVSAQEHKQKYAEGTLVLVMPESPLSVNNANEIFSVPGVDGYLIGVADLGASRQPSDPTLEEACEAIHAAGREARRARFDIVPSKAAAEHSIHDGAQVIVYNLTAILMETLGALLEV